MYLEGKLEGKLEGERLAKLETARRMLTMNLPTAIVTAATGLLESEVIALSKTSNG